ncbi:MAG: RluA family pseudouridine synthase [Bacteroidetes bacterium]|jgi:RluA family pseudouridine synthase|nr:RluA family pseudouridine synthase [Bacteroidota bacterium]
MAKQKHTVRQLPKGTNFIDYCRRAFPLLGSKTAVKKAVAGQRLLRNGRPARLTDLLQKGDRLELKGAGLPKARKFDKELPVVLQDDHLIIVNKPAGIAVNGNRVQTVENALAGLPPSPEADALPRPVAVHRIDLPTKGLVLLAKTKSALMALSQAFEDNEVDKAYQAVVHGQPPPQLTVDTPIDGKEAITKVETLRTVPSHVFGHLSLVELKPITGRTHQLRIHLQQQGHLIVGDKAYAKGQKTILGKGLFLCACALSFAHPATGKGINVRIDPPRRFGKTLDREERRSS